MTEVISISLIAGFVIFGFGVASAREYRRLREVKAQTEVSSREMNTAEIARNQARTSNAAMSMAAGGVRNEETNFETVGNHSR